MLRVVKGDERGGREIIQEQAETVNRVFSEFATGMSPNQIAHGLNNGVHRHARLGIGRPTLTKSTESFELDC